MNKGFWKTDGFAAGVFSLGFAVVAAAYFEPIKNWTYDLGVTTRDRQPLDNIAIISIDDASLQSLGRWPWPRQLQASMIDKLREGGAKAVVNTVFYSESQAGGNSDVNDAMKLLDAGVLGKDIPDEIDSFSQILSETAKSDPAVKGIAEAFETSQLKTQYLKSINELKQKLAAANSGTSPDGILAESFKRQGHVLLPLAFEVIEGRPEGRPDKPLSELVRRYALPQFANLNTGMEAIETINPVVPIDSLASPAVLMGHLNLGLEEDGTLRKQILVLKNDQDTFPSLALAAAAVALNLTVNDIKPTANGLMLGGKTLRTDSNFGFRNQFYRQKDGKSPFHKDSFFDVYSGKVPVSKYQDKVVLIGTSARGIGDFFNTPTDDGLAPVDVLAHQLSSILKTDYFVKPSWADGLQWLLVLVVGGYLGFVVTKLNATLAGIVSGGLAVGLWGTEFGLLLSQGLWLPLTLPALMVVFGHGFMMLKQLRLTEKLKISSDVESAESNKMLGLAFQGQGQLDMAFEKFRRVQPMDDKLCDLLYNLGLDFERKRQFNKAESVYQHIQKFNPKFRDIADKLSRAKKMSETVLLGGAGGSAGGTLVLSGSEKPMLGRYQVERELGKGAMGVVYLGKDPKIGRMVAIKTMALSQEFEPDELIEVKERFFREAETAGRLSHPNIVAIYDAGEEHDLAYIAMEFIKGYDLTRHVKANMLLPMNDVIKIIADAADALDYAHQNGVFHRDIKPANLMCIADTGVVKLTDFGIARIADSSKTKTGMVLGTPSYMSPEQLSGKKVDGRSDLFSLGVTLYQMLTGTLPFTADSMATLMFKIANEPHPDAREVRPELPENVVNIINRALHKDLQQRYPRGLEMAQDLRRLLK